MENKSTLELGASDEVMHSAKMISLRKRDGWFEYIHEDRCGGNIVAVLVYDYRSKMVIARMEHNPAHNRNGLILTSLTGGVDKGNGPRFTAQAETLEEAGMRFGDGEFIPLGTVMPYKAADTTVHLFAVDGFGQHPNRLLAVGDGSAGEASAYCEWMPARLAVLCEDPLVSAMIVRLRLYAGIDLLDAAG